MVKNYGIEENKLTDMEVISYSNYTGNIDYDNLYNETILKIIDIYVEFTDDIALEYMDDYF